MEKGIHVLCDVRILFVIFINELVQLLGGSLGLCSPEACATQACSAWAISTTELVQLVGGRIPGLVQPRDLTYPGLLSLGNLHRRACAAPR